MKPVHTALILSFILHGLLFASPGWSPPSVEGEETGAVLMMRIAKDGTTGIPESLCDHREFSPSIREDRAPEGPKSRPSFSPVQKIRSTEVRAKTLPPVAAETQERLEGEAEEGPPASLAAKREASSEEISSAPTKREAGLPHEYEALILERIAGEKRYPLRAKRRGMEGEVVLRFFLLPDGGIKEARAVPPFRAGRILREAAIASLRRAAPFPPPPAGWRKGRGVKMEVKMRYRLEG